jgi:hypothetical protein
MNDRPTSCWRQCRSTLLTLSGDLGGAGLQAGQCRQRPRYALLAVPCIAPTWRLTGTAGSSIREGWY